MLFLDDCFSAESIAVRLRTAGFTVQRFPEWFRDPQGSKRENVKDPEVIAFCNKHRWLLVTADGDMRNAHRNEIRKTKVTILATAHNSLTTPDNWVAAIITAKTRILREFRKRERPWFATISQSADLKFFSIT